LYDAPQKRKRKVNLEKGMLTPKKQPKILHFKTTKGK
jgi:hypothetical protein